MMEKPTLTSALAACLASFALFAAGCGGDDESSSPATTEASTRASTDEWADSFCSALMTWRNDLEEAAEPLTDLSSLSEESLQQAADDAKTATETLSDSLNGLGRPDISSGEQVRSSVQDLATDVENGANEIETAVEGVASVADIPSAIDTITTTVTDMGTEVDGAVQTLEDADASGELKTAFADADSCGELH
jgi:methyl-accepting chemotaxis protein